MTTEKITVSGLKLIGVSSDAKTVKGLSENVLTGILYLAPHSIAGRGNVCPHASEGCKLACLYTAGRGGFNSTQQARIRKTKAFFADPKAFVETLAQDIAKIKRKADKLGLRCAIRLNGTSDIPWEKLGGTSLKANLMERFPTVDFYDYTKNPARAMTWAKGGMPKNYHLTFSRSECNWEACDAVLKAGGNVAMVFSTKKGEALPERFTQGVKVIDGDLTDIRFYDPKGVIVGLRAKGAARKDTSGFVVHP